MLLFVGMGTVYVFLTVLVGATTLMSRLVTRLQPAVPAAAAADDEIAAISAALARHRKSRRNPP